jgi:hypothetical protein
MAAPAARQARAPEASDTWSTMHAPPGSRAAPGALPGAASPGLVAGRHVGQGGRAGARPSRAAYLEPRLQRRLLQLQLQLLRLQRAPLLPRPPQLVLRPGRSKQQP